VVDIEERLLRFWPEAALHAWRLFRLRTEEKRLVLSAPMYHDDTTGLTPLWPCPEAEATCYKGHSAPSPGCRCGIYGAVAGTLDSLPGYLCDTAYEHDPWAYAEIACYGRVFADMRGIRAEHARLVRIALPESAGPGEASPMLRDRYGVPVGGMESVPQWLTANVRPGGPPPDSESLNLDLARLNLSCRGDRSRTARLSNISPAPDEERPQDVNAYVTPLLCHVLYSVKLATHREISALIGVCPERGPQSLSLSP
jgi:hypothetical protein